MVKTKDVEKEKINSVLENVSNFIDNIRSKRVWIAVLVAAITALATALSSISNAWATFNKAPTAVKNVTE
jgi:intracellular sulfur oxidation DsrE/DsrF family protein